ncbi:MAG: undecaprenyl/decaprenyl-phosphate alpha-N-acetylglucosaminyl 1-phosphate transferase [Firmicutes bacterium]|nr:undecaprenyl/decaprenyl-phosphate alpha-N-acetylglucosaminyl 1-phosphate transferase [Bacillota bacterium]
MAFGLACGVSLIVTPLLIYLAPKLGAVDLPNQRKVHTGLMPCIGGGAIYLGFVAGTLAIAPTRAESLAFLLGGTIILVVGLIDDLYDISPYLKLAGQILAALSVVYLGIQVDFVTNPFNGEAVSLGILAVPLTVFWIVGVTNAMNLIDGLDGLAAGVAALAAVTMGIVAGQQGQPLVALGAFILAGSTVGFLRYNFHPARIFMGDSGAMFLGFSLAIFAMMGLTKSTTAFSLIIPFVILGIPLLDTFFAIVRRAVNRRPVFAADRDHLHHRLLAIGLSHQSTVLVIYAISVVYGATAIALTWFTTPQAFMVLGVLSAGTIAGASKLGILDLKLTGSDSKTTMSSSGPNHSA